MTTYIQQLETIIREMRIAVPQTQYQPWLHFLREIYPESELLQFDQGSPQAREPTEKEIKECSDIRELMMLAQFNKYPTWHIKPHGHDEQEGVLFPTDKIPTISSTKLEELFQKYLASMKERGIESDRIIMTGDAPILDSDGNAYISLTYQPTITH